MHPVRMVGHAAALLTVALLAAHTVSAQGSSGTVALTVPSATTTVAQGTTTAVSGVTVTVTVSNVVCAQAPAAAKVTILVTEASPINGLTFTYPSTVSIPMDAPQAYPQTSPFSKSAPVPINVTLTSGVLGNHEHKLNVTASFDISSDVSGCTVTPAAVSPKSTATGEVTLMTGANGGSTGGNGTMSGSLSGTLSGTGTNTSKASVSLPLAIEVALLAGIGIVLARRKTA